MSPTNRRAGLGRVEVLVLGLIAAVVMAMLLCAVSMWREKRDRLACFNNLRQLGLGFHQYHDTLNTFPTEHGPESPSFYRALLDVPENKVLGADPTRLFLCPARRTPAAAPGKRDYGYASFPETEPRAESILQARNGFTASAINIPIRMDMLFLAHVWMDPRTYPGGDHTDLGWETKNNSRPVNNTARRDSDATGSTSHMGSPHPAAMPSLFADGHVQDITYDFPYWAQLWNAYSLPPPLLP